MALLISETEAEQEGVGSAEIILWVEAVFDFSLEGIAYLEESVSTAGEELPIGAKFKPCHHSDFVHIDAVFHPAGSLDGP